MNGRHTTQNFLYTNQSKNPYGFDKAKRKSKFRQFSFFFFSPVHSILPFTEHYFPTKFGSLCLLLYRQQYTHHPNMYFVFFFLSLSFHVMCVAFSMSIQSIPSPRNMHTQRNRTKYHVFTGFVFFFQSIQNIIVISYRSKY